MDKDKNYGLKFLSRSRGKRVAARPQKRSRQISIKASRTLLHSVRTAQHIGRPFNCFLTINLWEFGLTYENASMFVRAVLLEERFARWSNYQSRKNNKSRNGTPTYMGVLEDAGGGKVHLHMMVYIDPPARQHFETSIKKWLYREFGTLPERALHIDTPYNPEGLKLYLAKGMSPFFARKCRVETVDCGEIIGPRTFSSRNIGPAVWKPLRQRYLDERRAKSKAA